MAVGVSRAFHVTHERDYHDDRAQKSEGNVE
jgi:hypothetical protein